MKKFFISILKNIRMLLPFLAGVFLLVSLSRQFLPENLTLKILQSSEYFQVLFANILGSIFFSNSAQSYILGGEFLNGGISLLAVTAFMVSWVTVGLVHLPMEIQFLGKKFAIFRNLFSFIFSFGVSYLTIFLYYLF